MVIESIGWPGKSPVQNCMGYLLSVLEHEVDKQGRKSESVDI